MLGIWSSLRGLTHSLLKSVLREWGEAGLHAQDQMLELPWVVKSKLGPRLSVPPFPTPSSKTITWVRAEEKKGAGWMNVCGVEINKQAGVLCFFSALSRLTWLLKGVCFHNLCSFPRYLIQNLLALFSLISYERSKKSSCFKVIFLILW